MIAILVVSHSRALARAALELASEMVAGPMAPRVAQAAGLDDGTSGTDAVAIAARLEELDSPDGTLVLMDLGSALLSAGLALDLVGPAIAQRVRLSPAPLVEGLVAGVVAAAGGGDLDAVAAQAEHSLSGKAVQVLGQATPEPAAAGQGATELAGEDDTARASQPVMELEAVVPLTDPHGLHARPAARLVAALAGLEVHATVGRAGGRFVDAHSITAVAGLGLAHGESLLVRLEGPDATTALVRIEAALRSVVPGPHAVTPDSGAEVSATEREVLVLEPDAGGYRPSSDERTRLQAALGRADDFLAQLAEQPGASPTEQTVLRAVRALLHDPHLIRGFHRRLDEGSDAVEAVRATMTEAATLFEAMPSPYFRERAVDLRALGRLVVKALREHGLELGELPAGRALEVDELDAVVAAQLDPARTPAVVVRSPGASGHGVMVARSRGIQVAVSPG